MLFHSATYVLQAVQKKGSSKHINMGSSFVDVDATSTVVKTECDLDVRLARYFFFGVRIYVKKRKSTYVTHPPVGLTTA